MHLTLVSQVRSAVHMHEAFSSLPCSSQDSLVFTEGSGVVAFQHLNENFTFSNELSDNNTSLVYSEIYRLEKYLSENLVKIDTLMEDIKTLTNLNDRSLSDESQSNISFSTSDRLQEMSSEGNIIPSPQPQEKGNSKALLFFVLIYVK